MLSPLHVSTVVRNLWDRSIFEKEHSNEEKQLKSEQVKSPREKEIVVEGKGWNKGHSGVEVGKKTGL